MYNSLVLPYFNYCSTVWHNFNSDHFNKLQKLHKRAACVITRSTYNKPPTQIFKKLHWRPIKKMLNDRDVIMTFKALKGLLPVYLMHLFNISNNNSYQLPSNNRNLCLPKPRTNFLKNSIFLPGS